MNNKKLDCVGMALLRPFCALVLVLSFSNPALAQDWRFEPVFGVGGEFDDNATLDPRADQEVDLSGLLFDIRADLNYTSPRTSFFLQPRLLGRNYNNESVQDSDDLFLRSSLRHRGGSSTFGYLARLTIKPSGMRNDWKLISRSRTRKKSRMMILDW